MKTIRIWWRSVDELRNHILTILDARRGEVVNPEDWTTEDMERTALQFAEVLDKLRTNRNP